MTTAGAYRPRLALPPGEGVPSTGPGLVPLSRCHVYRAAGLGRPGARTVPATSACYRLLRRAPLVGAAATVIAFATVLAAGFLGQGGALIPANAAEASALTNVASSTPGEAPVADDGIPLRPQIFVDQTAAAQAKPPADMGWFVSPVPDPNPTGYGMRFHPILHFWRMHNGDDMHADCGQTVVAAASGTVTYADWNGGYGYLVSIDNGKHDGRNISTNYAHLSVIGVRVGQQVKMGEGIAKAGSTGLSTGCHLHFEVLVNGAFVDPTPFLTGRPSPTANNQVPDLTPTDASPLSASSLKARIRFCESSNNYRATNPTSTASGAYQFLDGTWRGIPRSITGGTSRAMYASVAQQDAAFDWLYARSGTAPWASSRGCWDKGSLVVPTVTPTPTKTTTPTPSPTPTRSTSVVTPSPTPTTTTTATSTPTTQPTTTSTSATTAASTGSAATSAAKSVPTPGATVTP